MQNHPYFQTGKVSVLAHRGFTPPAENTLEAFQRALDAGADYLETDVRVTLDGHAVLCHDETLQRIAGIDRKVSEMSLEEIKQIRPFETGTIISLAEALQLLPKARFNIDIKESLAIVPTVSAIEENAAHDRVLVSSFSNSRRRQALKLLSREVATSGSGSIIIRLWIRNLFGLNFSKALSGIGAIQIPTKIYGMRFDKPRFIKKVRETGIQVHFWTINELDEVSRLVGLGATGIVTDETELVVNFLKK